MRQKKKGEDPKMEQDKAEACVKCSKMQNGGHCSYEEPEIYSKQTTLSTLKSVLKRSASSHKKDKIGGKGQPQAKESQQITAKKQKSRVQFDETQNKYFEADYVILIHEEDYDLDDYYDEGSPYDDEDDDTYDDGMLEQKICCSNPNCNNMISLGRYASSFGYANTGYVDFKYPQGPERERLDFSAHCYEEINQNAKMSSKSATNRCENEKCQNCRNYFDFENVGDQADTGGGDFGDQVTLSPPEGYKDGGGPQCCPHHGLQIQQMVDAAAEISVGKRLRFEKEEDDEDELDEEVAENIKRGEEIHGKKDPEPSEVEQIPTDKSYDVDNDMQEEEKPEKLKQRFIVETITMTTVTERRIVREAAKEDVLDGAKRGGILKGGKFWKNPTEKSSGKTVNYNEMIDYEENKEAREEEPKTMKSEAEIDNCNEKSADESMESLSKGEDIDRTEEEKQNDLEDTAGPEPTELTLTFKLGQHVLVANSLKPNSAVRQLFPSPRFLSPPPLPEDDEEEDEGDKAAPPKQFLVTAESLRLFEEAKKSKMLHNMNSNNSGQSFIAIMPPVSKNEDDASNNRIRRTIERNTLRRSLIRYPCDLRSKKLAEKRKKERSLEERIKQLTCDVDDEPAEEEKKEEDTTARSSPQGEESKQTSVKGNDFLQVEVKGLRQNESTSPSSNSSSSSVSSTYKKLTDIFIRKNIPIMEDVNCNIKSDSQNDHCNLNGPDLGNESILLIPMNQKNNAKNTLTRMPNGDTRKQFLSTLAPLAACVTSVEGKERLGERYRLIDGRDRFPSPVERISMGGEDTSEYTLDDIEEELKDNKKIGIQPDVIAGTPQNETPNDELVLFVQQDAGRIEKLKKRYSVTDDKSDEDDDYGFNKRPTVKGIRPRVSNEAREMGHKSWPYYSQENADAKIRADGNPHGIYTDPQDYRTYTEITNANYVDFKMRSLPYFNQSQQNLSSCQPMRIRNGNYPDIPNHQLRHPSHSPPPVRHLMMTPQPSPNPSDDGRNRNFDNSSDFDTRSEIGIPEIATRQDGIMRNPESIYYRRTVPNVHNPCLQMKFSPINYHQGVMPTASIRFSASCAPHPIVDESNVIIEPHYSTMPHPPGSVGVIRVGQGQQMIRVPVPYPTGSPVQLHLMAGRVGRCDSPQRPGSPQGLVRGPIHSYNQYLIAKGTQTAQIQTLQIPIKPIPDGAPSNPERIDFEAQGKAIAEELQTRQKLSRSLSQEPAGYPQARFQPRSSSPVIERGVPEGAASSSMQDGQPQRADNAQNSGSTIYYSMNV